MEQLNNPLRPKNLRTLPNQDEQKPLETTTPSPVSTYAKPITAKQVVEETTLATTLAAPNDEIQKAIALLSKNGIQLAGPKKVYMKHSFEVEKAVFEEFMNMYPSLGQKKQVKEAATEAFKLFNDKYRPEFDRIKKST